MVSLTYCRTKVSPNRRCSDPSWLGWFHFMPANFIIPLPYHREVFPLDTTILLCAACGCAFMQKCERWPTLLVRMAVQYSKIIIQTSTWHLIWLHLLLPLFDSCLVQSQNCYSHNLTVKEALQHFFDCLSGALSCVCSIEYWGERKKNDKNRCMKTQVISPQMFKTRADGLKKHSHQQFTPPLKFAVASSQCAPLIQRYQKFLLKVACTNYFAITLLSS